MTSSRMQIEWFKEYKGERKCVQQIFASPFFGPTKNPICSVVMTKGTNESKSEVFFPNSAFATPKS